MPYHAALTALAASPHGQLHVDQIIQAIESTVSLDDWAREVYANGNTRWRSIFGFASVGLVKGGYVTKSRGVWVITDEGRAVVNAPYNGPALFAEVNRRYQAWKGSQLAAPESATLALTVAHEDENDTADDDLDIPEPPEVPKCRQRHRRHHQRRPAGPRHHLPASQALARPRGRRSEANKSDQKIVLIDGVRLAGLMIEHNLGVSTTQTFALKRLDSDFFGEE